MTLLEVLTALAIFLMAMVVFGEMIVHNGQLARDIQRQNLATCLCKSKLQEVISGAVPLTSQGDAAFDEEPDYTWSLDADNGAVDGLWNVTVRVTYKSADATADPIHCSLTQMVLDPSIEGSTQDAVPVTASATNTNVGSSGGTGSSTSSTGTAGAAGSAASTGSTSSKGSTSTPAKSAGSSGSTSTPAKSAGSSQSSMGK